MAEIRLKNPVEGLSKMIGDAEHTVEPFVNEFSPIIKYISDINLFLVIAVFLGMMFYLIFVRKHSIWDKLTRPTNYFAALAFLGIYLFLTSASLNMGKDALGQDISLNLDFIAMPMAVKILGPVVGGFFGMIQYGASFLVRGQEFEIGFMLVAGISAMIYGRFLYKKRTKYVRCFIAKLLVNFVCNIVLVPFYDIWLPEMAPTIITSRLVIQMLLVPVQALIIYFALLTLRKVRKLLAEVTWGL